MKIHDLQAGPRVQDAAPARRSRHRGKGGKTAGRGTKGQGARGTVEPGFEGGQTPLHRRTPKAKGFKNPFRVEYQVVNLDTLEQLRRRHRGRPRRAARARPRRQARPGEGPRPGRAHRRRSPSRPTPSPQRREAAIEAAGGTVEIIPRAVGRRPSARRGQRPDQPVSSQSCPVTVPAPLTDEEVAPPCCPACGTCSGWPTCGTRSSSRS